MATGRRVRLPSAAVAQDAWALLLALFLCLPLVAGSGYPLARDLVFVPSIPFGDAVLGLGHGSPRSVPLDGVVAVLNLVVRGDRLATVVVPLVLAAAGWGARRLATPLGPVAATVAAGAAVWNPYVVERLALGQWALLAGYAALPWILLAASSLCRRPGRRSWAGVLVAVAAASLTPTGGLLGTAATAAGVIGRAPRRITVSLLAGCLVLQLPWLLPSVLGPAAKTSDAAGVAAFAANGPGPGGVLAAVLGAGGVWDVGSVPPSRLTWWGVLAAVVAVLSLALGARAMRRIDGIGRLAVLAAAGLVLALGSSTPWGASLLEWLLSRVPGAGLLRDSQKLLAPYALLVAVAVGAVAGRLIGAVGRRWRPAVPGALVLAASLPVILVPDATAATWPTVEPVRYPPGLAQVAQRLEGHGGALATLPWRSYRRFGWGNGVISSDPAVRWLDRDVLVSDDLQVGEVVVAGESPRAAALGRDLQRARVADALRASGVGWALVYRDDPESDRLDLSGLVTVYSDRDLSLHRVPGVRASAPASGSWHRPLVIAVDLAVGGMVAGLLAMLAPRRRKGARGGTG